AEACSRDIRRRVAAEDLAQADREPLPCARHLKGRPMNLERVSGLLLIVAAVTFVGGWVLMPDAGTADAAHILEAVSAPRALVWWSVVAHLVCGIAFVTAVVGVQSDAAANASVTARVGAWLVLVGAVGVCMDAFFHLMAYYLTAQGVTAQAAFEPM